MGVTDVGPGAKTTMNIIAADELGVPLSKVNVVWGDTDTCPYSVGESGSRTTIMTGEAVVVAARDIKKQIAEKGLPTGTGLLKATASPNPRLEGKVRNCFGAHFVEEKHGEGPRHYAATFGGMTLELYPGEADVGTRVGFAVADVDAAVSTLQALGASVRVAPKDSPWGRRAVVLDPDGRSVELQQGQARE